MRNVKNDFKYIYNIFFCTSQYKKIKVYLYQMYPDSY